MQKLKFGNDGPVTTEAEMLRFEQKHKLQLPEDYRQFLLKRTGSMEGVWWFDSIGEDDYVLGNELEDIYSLDEVDEMWDYHIDFCREFDEGYFPEPQYFHGVGLANGGNNLFMGFEKEYYGKIYLFCYEMYPDFHLLANSFTEFIEMLRPPERSEEEGDQ